MMLVVYDGGIANCWFIVFKGKKKDLWWEIQNGVIYRLLTLRDYHNSFKENQVHFLSSELVVSIEWQSIIK